MLTYDDALNMNYYKKTSFTGSMKGMRFVIKKDSVETEDPEKPDTIFHVWVWPGPYNYDSTDDSLKTDATFPFTEEGRKQSVDWVNQMYEENISKWPKTIKL